MLRAASAWAVIFDVAPDGDVESTPAAYVGLGILERLASRAWPQHVEHVDADDGIEFALGFFGVPVWVPLFDSALEEFVEVPSSASEVEDSTAEFILPQKEICRSG